MEDKEGRGKGGVLPKKTLKRQIKIYCVILTITCIGADKKL